MARYIADYARHSTTKTPQICAFTATAKSDVILEIICCEREHIPVRLRLASQMGRLNRVRECAELDRRLMEQGGTFLVKEDVCQLIRSLSPSSEGEPSPWQTLLLRCVTALWGAFDADQPLPAGQVRSDIQDLLIEANGEFTIGSGAYLATAHTAKGLEFNRVLIPPAGWSRNGNCSETESERRLFYVALTRAKEEVVVVDGGGHPFVSEFVGGFEARQIEDCRGHAARNEPVPSVGYNMLGLADLFISYPGRFSADHVIHEALRHCTAGTTVLLVPSDNDISVEFNGCVIAKLSKRATAIWRDKLDKIVSAKVYAMVERRQEQDLQSNCRVERWELPIIEIIDRKDGQPDRDRSAH